MALSPFAKTFDRTLNPLFLCPLSPPSRPALSARAGCVHIPPLPDSLRSIESKIQISVEIPSSKISGHPRLFAIFHSLSTIPLLLYSSSTHCLFPSSSLSVSSTPRSFLLSFLFLSPFFFIVLTLVLRLHRLLVRKVRNWPFGHERPRWKTAERANYGQRERIGGCGG